MKKKWFASKSKLTVSKVYCQKAQAKIHTAPVPENAGEA